MLVSGAGMHHAVVGENVGAAGRILPTTDVGNVGQERDPGMNCLLHGERRGGVMYEVTTMPCWI